MTFLKEKYKKILVNMCWHRFIRNPKNMKCEEKVEKFNFIIMQIF